MTKVTPLTISQKLDVIHDRFFELVEENTYLKKVLMKVYESRDFPGLED